MGRKNDTLILQVQGNTKNEPGVQRKVNECWFWKNMFPRPQHPMRVGAQAYESLLFDESTKQKKRTILSGIIIGIVRKLSDKDMSK